VSGLHIVYQLKYLRIKINNCHDVAIPAGTDCELFPVTFIGFWAVNWVRSWPAIFRSSVT